MFLRYYFLLDSGGPRLSEISIQSRSNVIGGRSGQNHTADITYSFFYWLTEILILIHLAYAPFLI
ncbi:hypothetical protein J3Q64DRAFT_1848093 [Phycomyces blakesleeanus]|uniref:Uncharacterized protein n=1 Tax=Phycomyces blakesleeanus TaxID=4837 RepID=A0ABR3B456_PHYBL